MDAATGTATAGMHDGTSRAASRRKSNESRSRSRSPLRRPGRKGHNGREPHQQQRLHQQHRSHRSSCESELGASRGGQRSGPLCKRTPSPRPTASTSSAATTTATATAKRVRTHRPAPHPAGGEWWGHVPTERGPKRQQPETPRRRPRPPSFPPPQALLRSSASSCEHPGATPKRKAATSKAQRSEPTASLAVANPLPPWRQPTPQEPLCPWFW
mmetsp:Transcript_31904/g.91548  ORF Transcript_31904/g.91548 Transcript_31904/m.91548 type:complete len:214 (+) Transcript_31904:155-796(+)